MTENKETRKAKALMVDYPFVGEHYHEFCVSRSRGKNDLEVRVVVQRADTSLMYRRPNNAEGCRPDGSCSWICTSDGHKATLHEYGQCIREDETVILFDDEGKTRTDKSFVLGKHRVILRNNFKYILWVKVYDWYEQGDGDNGEAGPFVKTELIYEIHLPPKSMSFLELARMANLAKNVELTTRDLMNGIMRQDPAYLRASERLQEIAHSFQTRVYERGLRKLIDASDSSGMCGTIGSVHVMSWVMAGRIMITMEAPNPTDLKLKDSFTILGAEGEDDARFGCQSITATVDRAEAMVDMIAKAWDKLPAKTRTQTFSDDQDVRMLGM